MILLHIIEIALLGVNLWLLIKVLGRPLPVAETKVENHYHQMMKEELASENVIQNKVHEAVVGLVEVVKKRNEQWVHQCWVRKDSNKYKSAWQTPGLALKDNDKMELGIQ